MTRLGYYLQRALSMPPHVALGKAAGKLRRELGIMALRRRDGRRSSYAAGGSVPQGDLFRYCRAVPANAFQPQAARLAELAEHSLAHRFDLLGSGRVEVRHGMDCRGLEGYRYPPGEPVPAGGADQWLQERINPANRAEAARIRRLVDGAYTPIDWHLDFKSGHRWSEACWYQDIRYGRTAGSDIKVPWELARMQHLPQLAGAHALATLGTPGGRPPAEYAAEFRNQVLDFIAANPPRWGVNWQCAMDIGIRVANWLLAYDLFLAHGADFSPEFRANFTRSVYEHGLHTINNLEWSSRLRSNHYLADIAGLLFVAAYLPRTPETDRWLGFAVQELIAETQAQFTPDGANFEASTCYHRLSAEMVLYSTALIAGLPAEKRAALAEYDHRGHTVQPPLKPAVKGDTLFPDWYGERLERMAEFTMDITRPDGRVPQIGDNDSGRFFKLEPAFDAEGREDVLDHRHLPAAAGGLFDRQDFAAGGERLDTAVVSALAGGFLFSTTRGVLSPAARMIGRSYDCFGLYILRSQRVYLAARCGPNGQNSDGGHAHNDQLSIELALDGLPVLVDPGTYLYTAVPEQRNRFRSTAMHNTLALAGSEQNAWMEGPPGLFGLPDRARARLIGFDHHRFEGEHRGYGEPHLRLLELQAAGIKGVDRCAAGGEKLVCFHLAPSIKVAAMVGADAVRVQAGKLNIRLQGEGSWAIEESSYSPAYGVIEPGLVVVLRSNSDVVSWSIEIEVP